MKTTYEYKSSQKECDKDLHVCPDRSTVSRTGKSCSFAPCVTTEPTIAESKTKNWEEYVNDYAFTIRYPQEVFTTKADTSSENHFILNEPVSSPAQLSKNGVWLNIQVSSPSADLDYQYEKILHVKESALIPESNIQKIKDTVTDGVSGSVYYQGKPPHAVGKISYSYGAIWLKDGLAYQVVVSSFSEQLVKNMKPVFEAMVKTASFGVLYQRPDRSYVCPNQEWIDCVSSKNVNQVMCGRSYLSWAQAHCVNFKGVRNE